MASQWRQVIPLDETALLVLLGWGGGEAGPVEIKHGLE